MVTSYRAPQALLFRPSIRKGRCEIVGVGGEKIRTTSEGEWLSFQLTLLPGRPGREEQHTGVLKEKTLLAAAPFTARIDILTSMCGISVFIAIAVAADITGIILVLRYPL
jgi:hypothetical protein